MIKFVNHFGLFDVNKTFKEIKKNYNEPFPVIFNHCAPDRKGQNEDDNCFFKESMIVIITIFSPTGEDEMHVLRLKRDFIIPASCVDDQNRIKSDD